MRDQLVVPGVCDEIYIKVKGRWTYLYRAVDKQWNTVDFLLSERRNVAAAKRFFRKAIKNNGGPRVLTFDAYPASHRAIADLKATGIVPGRVRGRSSKYLNNVVEQDPPPTETADPSHAWIQALRHGGGDDRRY